MQSPIVSAVTAADRAPLESMLRSIVEFDAGEVAVALELIDSAIASADDYRVLVARAGTDPTGYVCFGPTPMTRGTYDLYWIASAPEARRTGVGRALVAALDVELRAASARLVRVETSSRDDYASTRGFYDRVGFQKVATIPAFYDVEDDLLIYARYY